MDVEKVKKDFEDSYDQNVDALFRHCMFKISDRELAIDIVQETFTRTWDYLAKGKEITNLRAFLYRTLNNLIIDEYRKKKSVSLDVLSEDGFDPKDETEFNPDIKIEGERALKLLDQLPEPYKEAVFLRYINSLELSEISEITGESENTVSVHVHRGLNKLRELFNNERQ